MNQTQPLSHPSETVAADGGSLEAVAGALRSRGICALVAADCREARRLVLDRLPDEAGTVQVTPAALATLTSHNELNAQKDLQALSNWVMALDAGSGRNEKGQLAASPDYLLATVEAVTQYGSLVLTSDGVTQVGPAASGAGTVIFVVDRENVVPDLDAAFRRICASSVGSTLGPAATASDDERGIDQVLIISGDSGRRLVVVLIDQAMRS